MLTQVQPITRVFKLFQHMVFTNWDNVITEARQAADQLDQRVLSLKENLKSIRKAKDDGLYTLEQAKDEADKVQQQVTVLEMERSDMRIEQYNTEVEWEFSEKSMNNLSLLWDNLDLPKRQALLQKIFMGSIVAEKDKIIRTSQLSPSFQLIEALKDEKDEIVTPTRFELVLTG